jgi:DNA-binding PadR family transcriptional regulator
MRLTLRGSPSTSNIACIHNLLLVASAFHPEACRMSESKRTPAPSPLQAPAPDSFLPLKAPVFHALVALGRGERHGYALLKEIRERSGGVVAPMPAALYRHLQRMLEDGLIEEAPRRAPSADDDERRRYYRITALGRRVTEAEVRRLDAVLADAKRALRPRPAGAQ